MRNIFTNATKNGTIGVMTAADLRSFLLEARLSQAEFAKLVDVTPRAISMWLSDERKIPGPVDAYARVFRGLTVGTRQAEVRRLKEIKATMRDGMYAVLYHSGTQGGYATVILDNGRAYGADPAGGKYDGHYDYDDATNLAKVQLKVTFPPHVPAVFAPAQPFEWSVDITGDLDPRLDRGFVAFTTALGPTIQAQYQFLRELPTGDYNGPR